MKSSFRNLIQPVHLYMAMSVLVTGVVLWGSCYFLDSHPLIIHFKPRVPLMFFWPFLGCLPVFLTLVTALAFRRKVMRLLLEPGEAAGKAVEPASSLHDFTVQPEEEGLFMESFNQNNADWQLSEKIMTWQIIARRLAHEIRNPLTPIKLLAQRVKIQAAEGALESENVMASMDTILQEVHGLDAILQDFRSFAEDRALNLESFSMAELIREVVDGFRVKFPLVDWGFEPGEGATDIFADRGHVHRLLDNLMTNAVEAGSDRVGVRLERVPGPGQTHYRIQVRDNGEGIPRKTGLRIFYPYVSTRVKRPGLGLAVVERIVYNHGGRVWFESRPGLATVFYVELPAGERL